MCKENHSHNPWNHWNQYWHSELTGHWYVRTTKDNFFNLYWRCDLSLENTEYFIH